MPRGHANKRESKKPKKKTAKPTDVSASVFATAEVEVVKKQRKPRRDEQEEEES